MNLLVYVFQDAFWLLPVPLLVFHSGASIMPSISKRPAALSGACQSRTTAAAARASAVEDSRYVNKGRSVKGWREREREKAAKPQRENLSSPDRNNFF